MSVSQRLNAGLSVNCLNSSVSSLSTAVMTRARALALSRARGLRAPVPCPRSIPPQHLCQAPGGVRGAAGFGVDEAGHADALKVSRVAAIVELSISEERALEHEVAQQIDGGLAAPAWL